MANQKHKKQTRDQDRLEILKDYGPFLLDCDVSDMLNLISGQFVHGGSADVALSKRFLQRMLEEGRAKIITESGMIFISRAE